YEPIAKVAIKLKGEVKYHVLHANTWIKNLGASTEEAILRLQSSLNEALPYALGMFEQSTYEQELIDAGIYAREEAVKAEWLKRIQAVIEKTELKLPDLASIEPKFGGRYGKHTEHLQP